MRVAAVSLPELRVEIVRALAPEGDAAKTSPLAIVVAPPPMTEAKLLGNTRIDVVSREARRLGVRPGQTVAQARARAPGLAVRVVAPSLVHGELERLAEVALAFGATVAYATGDDVVWVDVTGCAHLFARPPAPSAQAGDLREPRESSDPREDERARKAEALEEAEGMLASRLARVIEGFGHACAVAVADGPRASRILARVASEGRASSLEPPIVVVPAGENAAALGPLPVGVLPLAPEDVRWLVKLGVRTVAQLRDLPRASLTPRLGASARAILALADGDDRAPLTPYVPPEIPEEEVSLEYGVSSSEALVFVTKTLTDRVALRLAGRAAAAGRLELVLHLDEAVAREDGEADEGRVVLDLPAPLSSASDLLAALRPRIERLVLRAPVLRAKLRVPVRVNKPQTALTLFEATPRAERALPRLIAELTSDLEAPEGTVRVGRLVLGDAWSPSSRSRFEPFAPRRPARMGDGAFASPPPSPREPARKARHVLSSVPEPSRVLDEPVTVPRDAVKVIRHLTRLHAVEWWKQLAGEVPSRGVDHVYAWVEEGPAWVELDRARGTARVMGWFD